MAYTGKKPGNVNTDFLEAGGELANHDEVTVDASGNISTTGTVTTNAIKEVSGNVGIGTTSPGHKLQVSGGNLYVPEGYIYTSASQGLSSPSAGSDLPFHIGGTEKMRLLSTGGITFNGDTAAANALDDYEEGTWTPTYVNTGTSGFSYDLQLGWYTKIGRQVTAGFNISSSGMSANTALAITIAGLPFAGTDATPIYGNTQRGTFEAIYLTVPTTTQLDMQLSTNTSQIWIREFSSGGGNVNATWGRMTDQNSCQIRGTITYQAA